MRSSRRSSSRSRPDDRRKPSWRGGLSVVALALLLGGCNATPAKLATNETPATLSSWGLLAVLGDRLVPTEESVVYELTDALFSDYAHKLRTVWVPSGESARLIDDRVDFPVGSILTKTFYYPVAGSERSRVARGEQPDLVLAEGGLDLEGLRLIETRLLVRRASGWISLPYVWNDQQTDATLRMIGDEIPLTLQGDDGEDEAFLYIVPDANQCAGCHVTRHGSKALEPIGPKVRLLDRSVLRAGRTIAQLEHWVERGLLEDAPTPARPTARSLDDAARAYLDINCGHCHNPEGPADTSGLFLDIGAHAPRRLGVCKPPIAAGRGSGGRAVSIEPGEPDASIMAFRMASADPGIAMPELGRSVVHHEGVALIRDWITTLSGACERVLPSGL